MHDVTKQQEKVCILGTLAGGAEIGYRPHFHSTSPSLFTLFIDPLAGCIKHKRHLHVCQQISFYPPPELNLEHPTFSIISLSYSQTVSYYLHARVHLFLLSFTLPEAQKLI